MSAAASVSRPASSVAAALAPIMIAVLTGFLVIGAALPVLPLHVHGLGFGPAMIGAVSGCQFAPPCWRASGLAGLPTCAAPNGP
jgi:hypothetical protein